MVEMETPAGWTLAAVLTRARPVQALHEAGTYRARRPDCTALGVDVGIFTVPLASTL